MKQVRSIEAAGILFYRLFVFLMLSLAIFYSNQAINDWEQNPTTVSVNTKSTFEVQFPAVSVCRPLSWKWPGIATFLLENDKSGTIAKKIISQKNTDMLTFYFDSQNEKCKRLLAGFPSFDPDFFDQFNENQTLGLLFMHYAMRKVITQSSGKNCDQLYRLFLPMRNLYLAKRLDPDLDFGNTSQIITEICGVPEDILDKGKRECDEVHVKIVKSWFDTNVTWDKVRDANCSQLMGENNNTFVMDWCLECWKDKKKCTGCWTNYKGELNSAISDICQFETGTLNPKQYIDILMSSVLQGTPGKHFSLIEDYVNQIEAKTKVNVLASWNYLNAEDLKKAQEFDQVQKVQEAWKSPKVHGDYIQDFVLIPFCSFGTSNLTKCDLFEEVQHFYLKDQLCHTFNTKGNIKAKKISGEMGLNLMTNLRFPLGPFKAAVSLSIHPTNVLPDLDYYSSNTFHIRPGKQYFFGIEATLTNVTENFGALRPDQRQCFLNSGHKDQSYNHINCRMQTKIYKAKTKCGCLPWYLWNQPNTETLPVCGPEGLKCFAQVAEEWEKYSKTKRICPHECINTKYTIRHKELDLAGSGANLLRDDLRNSYGNEFKKYLDKDNPDYFVKRWYLTGIMENLALIHVNFDTEDATVIVKDAKVTFADILGNIGGTFGVFLGLSFVGILNFLISLFKWFHKKMKMKW